MSPGRALEDTKRLLLTDTRETENAGRDHIVTGEVGEAENGERRERKEEQGTDSAGTMAVSFYRHVRKRL